jgi:OmpA-OmpF porin, OOP family
VPLVNPNRIRPNMTIALGVFTVFMLALAGARLSGPGIAAELSAQADAAIARAGGSGAVTARFFTARGLPSRHPQLEGGETLDEETRASIARAVAAIPGVGGVRWADSSALVAPGEEVLSPLHCQDDVAGLLRSRSIRFKEGSAQIDEASRALVGEVAAALRPCLGATIRIDGHTDASGQEPDNLALSTQRAVAVREALISRGIPASGLHASGLGSSRPVEGLDPADPANRRIEFSVVAIEPLHPTPVDTPGPR